MSVFDGKHVIAVNANGEKQEIPAHWLDHPVLGKGFTETPSSKARKSRGRQALKPVGEGFTETPSSKARKPRGKQDPKPVGEGETKEKKDA